MLDDILQMLASEPVQAAIEDLNVHIPNLETIYREVLTIMESLANGEKESIENYVERFTGFYTRLVVAVLQKTGDLLTRFDEETFKKIKYNFSQEQPRLPG